VDIVSVVVEQFLGWLIAATVGVGVKTAWDRLRRRHANRGIAQLMGPGPAPVVVVGSSILDEKRSDYLWPACDWRAAMRVGDLLRSIGEEEGEGFSFQADNQFVTVSDPAPEDVSRAAKGKNLVLLGGPKHNSITRMVLETAKAYLRYQYRQDTEDGPWYLYDTVVAGRIELEEDDEADRGLLVSLPSPFDPDRRVLVLAGVHGSGTLGAAQILTDPRMRDALLASRMANHVIETVVAVHYEPGSREHVGELSLL